jgi:hypothetical protein
VRFNRDIRPILSDHCFQCHGPDRANRKAKLQLDLEAVALADRGGYHAIVPGRPDQSELITRITAADPRERMPPASTGKKLSAKQIDLLRRWIDQGAKWEKHWAFLPPQRPPLPAVKDARWPRNPIDHFVLARLEQAGLRPSPEAEKTALIRRVTLDLTGLPPTPAEVDAFLTDPSPHAYEKVVDRLLQSPRYGERMALPWLEAARYADTNGYQTDGERFMWRWRDWVIEAINQNMPFDQFTVEQLAGDLLPSPTLEQRIATGFNRNHRGNSEGGVIPEEYAVEYVVDRVDTTFTVWLGLTAGCARCHDHKYDPISQKEFYQLFAYFNNVPERGKAIKYGNSPPMIKAPTREQRRELNLVMAEWLSAGNDFRKLEPTIDALQRQWEKGLLINTMTPFDWTFTDGLRAWFPLDGDTANVIAPRKPARFKDGQPRYVPGVSNRAAELDGTSYLDAGNVGNFGFFDKFTVSAWVFAKNGRGGTLLSRMADTDRAEGYSVVLEGGKLHVNLVKRWLDDAIRVETASPLPPFEWRHVLVTYDGSRVADGIKVYVDGKRQKLKVNLDDLNQSFKTSEPFRIGAGGGPESRFHGMIEDVRIYDRVVPPEEAEVNAAVHNLTTILGIPAELRTRPQQHKLRAYFLAEHAPLHLKAAHARVRESWKRFEMLDATIPTTMVMEEMPTPRDTHVLIRGEYDKKGEKVQPGLPAALPPLPAGAPNNRLGFARWVVDPANPLTARVVVNRYWQMLFGTGLVKTVEDFGAQGEWPSHPELLDWLATEFVRTGWDVKALLRTIVTSATYRQSSKVTKELLQRDPDNRLLARGPRVRLSAEMIRDQALFVSGLLVEKQGGPSVKPYQPQGLWKDLAGENYVPDKGASLYRRSLYTFWKRTIAPPGLMTFDSAHRESCVVRETRTNTPLQALNLLNDVTYVEAARRLAERVLLEAGPVSEARLTYAFRLVTARTPRPVELQVLRGGLERHLARYRKDPKAAAELLRVGESPRNTRLEVSEWAAWTALAGTLLNLDEVITKE